MDPLNGGGRLCRLPPVLSVRASGLRPVSGIRRCCRLAAATGALLLAGSVGVASAGSYRAHDGASLQAAVADADAGSGTSTIELAAGTFLPTSTLSITRDVTIVGPSSTPGAKLAGSAVEPFPSDLFKVEAHAKLTLRNVQLTASGGAGSAAAIDDFGALDVESSTVAGNNGPGVLVQPGATATVRNSTLSDGLSAGLVDEGSASLFNSTVAFNKGGGIENTGAVSLTNTIVAQNGSSDCTKPATASDHSLDSDGSCHVGALSRTDPRLERLAGNGGPTATRALGAGSPAIGAGDDSNCPSEDQRHFARAPGRCDLGAYQTGALAAGGSPTGPPGAGSGPSEGAGTALVGVSGHGALRGARRSRIAFSVRAEVGHTGAGFLYRDGPRRVALHTIRLRSIVIDGRRGVATLRGTAIETGRRRGVGLTLVLTSHSGHRSLRIRLSSGYYVSGPLLSGSITFIRRA